MSSIPKVHALIVAAGQGNRFGSPTPKQYTTVAGKTVLEHSVAALAASAYIQRIQLVISAIDTRAQTLHYPLPVDFAIGGTERWLSVQAGVHAIIGRAGSHPSDLVLVHDAARPCVTRRHIEAVIKLAAIEKYGAILGIPVADTLKKVTGSQKNASQTIDSKNAIVTKNDDARDHGPAATVKIVQTLPRKDLWQAQTPQVFRLQALNDVLEQVAAKKLQITDEASAFEYLGYEIGMVQGSAQNLKLTYPEDSAFIETVLSMK